MISIFKQSIYLFKQEWNFSKIKLVKNLWKNYFCVIYQQIDFYNFKCYKSFFILKNLKKQKKKYEYLLRNIISELPFLLYTYQFIINYKNIQKFETLNWIIWDWNNINWYKNFSQSLKKISFMKNHSWQILFPNKLDNNFRLEINFFQSNLVETAFYLVFSEICSGKLDYFSSYLYSSKSNKTIYSVLRDVKLGWQKINWYLFSNTKNGFKTFRKKKLLHLLEQNIKDPLLLSLLEQIWEIKYRKSNKINLSQQKDFTCLFFYDIHFKLLDKFVETFFKQNYVLKRLQIDDKCLLEKDLFNFDKFKYLRYSNHFLIGINGGRKNAFAFHKIFLSFFQNSLHLECKALKFVNVVKNSFTFLSCKISYLLQKNRPVFQKQTNIKEFENSYKIKKKIKSNLNKNLFSGFFNQIWNQYRINLNKTLSTIHSFKENDFVFFKKNFLNKFKKHNNLNFKQIAKTFFIHGNSKISNDYKIIKIIQNNERYRNKLVSYKIRDKYFISRKYIVKSILKCNNYRFDFMKYKLSSLIKKIMKKCPKLVWFWPKLLIKNVCSDINRKNIYNRNKITSLIESTLFWKINRPKWKWENISNFKQFFIMTSIKKKKEFIRKITKKSYKLVFVGNLDLIYKKLRKNKIIQQKKKKIETIKTVLLFEDFKIFIFFSQLAKSILDYFFWCDNFIKIKRVVQYYIRFSLLSTLKQKYNDISAKKIIKTYGKLSTASYSYKNNNRISFISKYDINNWSFCFRKKRLNINRILLFKRVNL